MRLMSILLAGLAVASLSAGTASAAPSLDAQGKCRDNGKFVAASMCTTTAPTAGRCRDIKTKKFAKCGTAGTEPVPTSTASAPATTGAK